MFGFIIALILIWWEHQWDAPPDYLGWDTRSGVNMEQAKLALQVVACYIGYMLFRLVHCKASPLLERGAHTCTYHTQTDQH